MSPPPEMWSKNVWTHQRDLKCAEGSRSRARDTRFEWLLCSSVELQMILVVIH